MYDIEKMTLEEKIGQMIGLAFGGQVYSQELATQVEKIKTGLIIYFKDNIKSPEQSFDLNREIYRHAKIPPFIALDQEGGMVARITEGITQSPGAMAIGATRSPAYAYEMAKAMGTEIRKLGFNFNFAPVADVNNNPLNPVINVRSYSEDPDTVAEYVNAAIKGYSEAMLMTSIKHFPGHGDTSVDSHVGLPKIDYDEKRLLEVELKPFIQAIAENAPGIMASHVLFTYYDKVLPTSISEKIITGLLRGKLGYDGLVVTDSLTMDAIYKHFTLEEIVLYGFNSGCDMLLLCGARDIEMQEAFFNTAVKYAREGKISLERINDSVRRILRYKQMFKVGQNEASFETVNQSLLVPEHVALSKRISEASITVVKDENHLIPLRPEEKVLVVFPRIKVVTLVENDEGVVENLTDALNKYHPADVVFMPLDPSPKDMDDLLAKIIDYDKIIYCSYNASFYPVQASLINRIGSSRLITIAMRAPYDLKVLPGVSTYLCSYEATPLAFESLSKVLTGKMQATGKLPVTL